MVKSIIPQVFTSMYDASLHLIQHGWVVVSLLSSEQVNTFTNDIHASLHSVSGSTGSEQCNVFHSGIPRTLGGMIKTHHASMLRPVHELRKLARTRFYEFLSQADQHVFDHTNFAIPNNENELTCNPDAIFVSSSLHPRFPRAAREHVQKGGLWWHVDTDEERSFIQGSVVLQNPIGSEEFCVYSESHKHFDVLDDSRRLGSDFYMLSLDDLTKLQERGCEAVSLQVPSGSYVLWYSSTVHTVKPFGNALEPRVQMYVTFAPLHGIRGEERQDLELMKVLAVLLGGSCRHLPYPCGITWQNGYEGYTRDLIPFGELSSDIMFSRIEDYSDTEFSIYGLDLETVRESIDFWSYNWNEQMNTWKIIFDE